jgi:prevent-host-death family protein
MYMEIEMPKTYSIAEARKELSSLIRSVETGSVVELTRRGKPVAVLLSTRDYAAFTGSSADLWRVIQNFRRDHDLDELAIDEVYQDLRDRSPGRPVEL